MTDNQRATAERRGPIKLRTSSGATFTILRDFRSTETPAYTVIDATGGNAALRMRGRYFLAGKDTQRQTFGYGAVIQQAVNRMHDLHSAYGVASPSRIIREQPA